MTSDQVLPFISSTVELASLYGIVVLGLVLSFRIIGFADLTMESSFTLGAAVGAVAIAQGGLHPVIALLLGALCGFLAGLCTALLHTKGRVSKLLSGIIMMTVLYSVNLEIMGKANYQILDYATIFEIVPFPRLQTILCLAILGVCFLLLLWFLNTEFGYFLRATGESPRAVTKLGRNVGLFTILGLMLSNGLIALGGGLTSQYMGYADVGMGTGLIVSTLAALILGEAIVAPRTLFRLLLAAIIGSLVYRLAFEVGLRMNIHPWHLKIAIGILLALAVIAKKWMYSRRSGLNVGAEAL